jgi:hypothetical protein
MTGEAVFFNDREDVVLERNGLFVGSLFSVLCRQLDGKKQWHNE